MSNYTERVSVRTNLERFSFTSTRKPGLVLHNQLPVMICLEVDLTSADARLYLPARTA